MKTTWWKESVVYQIYPRSFMDGNGDGIGDLSGILSKLDYLKGLGVDVLWICPIYKSPNDDNGYDISDYCDIMEEFGTMAQFDELLAEAHKRGIKIIMDLVINHTSDEHPWFVESRSSKDNPKRDYYIWRPPGKTGEEPNNWESIFGGSAWQLDESTGEYYMHLFSTRQPDLNWENEKVRRDLYDMINWWLDKGIDGFRVDAITHIKKIQALPDLPNPLGKKYVTSWEGHRNREGILDYLRELRDETFAKYDIMTVGEANGVELEQAEDFVGEKNGVFNMMFQFEHMSVDHGPGGKWDYNPDWKLTDLKDILSRWQNGLENRGWNALFLENHDVPRSVSRFANDKEHHAASAKMLATLYMLMQGTPYIYQGQEIGMTNVSFASIEDYRDVEIMNLHRDASAEGWSEEKILAAVEAQGRDNARTPMQWDVSANAGFTTGTPWIGVNPNYTEINVQAQIGDEDSILNHYRRLIALRKSYPVAVHGSYELLLPEDERIFAYLRRQGDEALLVVCSFSELITAGSMPEELAGCKAQLLLDSGNPAAQLADTGVLPEVLPLQPYESRVYLLTLTKAAQPFFSHSQSSAGTV
ncbi:MalL2 [Paenibacillus mucilaginosus 3016]|uniref:MalL2 n=1 Tax=Paenibacillus mucilaginosus 3016 TaxID=1116391 RepID=H6NHV1_9BACL|nr:alpha-glucosidase [Paenibacillus mucilaginosus]AFC30172.1 MalL2 [Paenibacillus mucilaginosus 3016]WFA18820.1 alpha-glucosidase [Paenibacillus mucilaginosus]